MYISDKEIKALTTFGIPCIAKLFFSFTAEEELTSFIRDGKTRGRNVLVIGGGSNILFTGDYEGLIIHPENTGIKVEHLTADHADVRVAAGVIWDDFVAWAVAQGFAGVENLSLIPGMTGASPVQNIGAYGAEAKDTLLKVRFISLADGKASELTTGECRPGYRDSIFKGELKNKVVVTSVCFRLSRKPSFNIAYPDLAGECEGIGGITLDNIRQAVINIRRRKLPDPAVTGNAGSFFKNPIIPSSAYDELKASNPGMPAYRMADGSFKLAAGWLIDQCGWKGRREGDAGVHPNQALVLVNYGEASGRDIINLAEKIRESVKERFSVDLMPEVEII